LQIVPEATMPPGCCIVTQSTTGPFIDTGLTPAVLDPRVYVSKQAIVDMGRLFGIPTPEDVERLVADVERMTTQLVDLRAQLAEADRYADAAEYTLKATFGDDTKIKNKPGRKPKVSA
jgi:hypothetical protein